MKNKMSDGLGRRVPIRERQCPKCKGRGIASSVNGEAMRRVREDAGLSLRELGRRIGMSAQYVSDMELGRRAMSMETAKRIVEVCDGQ